MAFVFSYGMLRQEAVQLSTFGRLLHGRDDELIGFELQRLRIEDPLVVAESGETHYDNALFNGNPDSRVSGMVFEVSDDELAAADTFEQRAAYTRIEARLASGNQAWVYVEARSAPDAARF